MPIKHIIVISSAVIACVSLFLTLKQPAKNTNEPITIVPAAKTTAAELIIDIEGAVTRPGVYALPSKSRVVDGLIAAGGLTQEADRYVIAKQLNLAKQLTHEEKIYIPYLAEHTSGNASEIPAPISINSASLTQLELLPHVGTITAEKIVRNRPFTDLTDLVSKRIISHNELLAIQSLITL
ncbi:MAG: SLBB domain-containing protein [Candidatus Roizmanbacteria bacterium]|nr:SLBB domain-containing protein [Candidatus Roizmanbacteria bacterium]